MGWLDRLFGQKEKSGAVAKQRLQMVLIHDRSEVSPGLLEQIKDDIIGVFGDEKKIGKSVTSDLQENKKTILTWHAWNNSSKKDQSILKKIFSKKKVLKSDLLAAQEIFINAK